MRHSNSEGCCRYSMYLVFEKYTAEEKQFSMLLSKLDFQDLILQDYTPVCPSLCSGNPHVHNPIENKLKYEANMDENIHIHDNWEIRKITKNSRTAKSALSADVWQIKIIRLYTGSFFIAIC